jgi:hypothetical protein
MQKLDVFIIFSLFTMFGFGLFLGGELFPVTITDKAIQTQIDGQTAQYIAKFETENFAIVNVTKAPYEYHITIDSMRDFIIYAKYCNVSRIFLFWQLSVVQEPMFSFIDVNNNTIVYEPF